MAKKIDINSTFAYKYFTQGIAPSELGDVKVSPALVISKYPKVVAEYQGKFPVIYIDFAGVDPSVASLKQKIGSVFSLYNYIVNPYYTVCDGQSSDSYSKMNAEHTIRKFIQIQDVQISESELLTA